MKEKQKFTDQARALTVQKHQLQDAQDKLGCLYGTLEAMENELHSNQDALDKLLVQAHTILSESEIIFEVGEEGAFLTETTLHVSESEIVVTHQAIDMLDRIEITDATDWEQYLDKVEAYASRHGIEFGDDPFRDLMSVSQRIALEKRIREEFSLKGANCDTYDYMIAGTCGLIGGFIDIFFTWKRRPLPVPKKKSQSKLKLNTQPELDNTPKPQLKQGELTNFMDDLVDEAVQKFAEFCGWPKAKAEKKGSNLTASAIGFLEWKGDGKYRLINIQNEEDLTFFQKYLESIGLIGRHDNGKYYFYGFRANYDHSHGGAVDRLFDMSTKNHHIKSLGHSPDVVGLFFSVLDQFNSTAHFVDGGRIISIDSDTFELKGSNFASKVFAGFVNWLGHLISDIAGSSGAAGRGSGIPIPFYSLLQFVNVGKFIETVTDSKEHERVYQRTFATIAVRVFEEGYDFRHGMALAVPVLVTELLTRIMWVVKQRFYHETPWNECLPSAHNPELRRMLLIAHGSLCLVDTTDATLRSGGDMIQFMLRSNLIAWARFGTIALKELNAWYHQGGLDVEAVDEYLDAEYVRLLAK